MQETLQALDRQIEYIRSINSITEKLFNQLETWSKQELTVVLDQEWEGIQERDNLYGQAMLLEELLKENPYYSNGNDAIKQKINDRNECIVRIREMDHYISESFQTLKEKMTIQLSNMKQKNKVTQRYGQLTWYNPAFIDERK